jgi:hypothetical protein
MTWFEDQRLPEPSRQRSELSSYTADCDTNQLSTHAGVPRDTAEVTSQYERISLRASGWLRNS